MTLHDKVIAQAAEGAVPRSAPVELTLFRLQPKGEPITRLIPCPQAARRRRRPKLGADR